jgi:HAE1 family hydrophobic/amphiphilic exporter-1
MRYLAERRIKLELETLNGVASAQVQGGLEEEIQIEIDQERLAALGIPIDRIREVVGVSNVNLPGGALRGEDTQFLIRTVNEFDSVDEIADLIVWRRSSGAYVRLREIATVRRGFKEREEITRVRGRESVELSIFKEGDANTVTVAALVRAKIEEWEKKLPPGHRIEVLFDQSGFIESSVNEVRDAAVQGGALAVIALLAFLRDLRSTLVIALTIPLSLVGTFVFMYRFGLSLNVMSLGGLALGIGNLVDCSIVVLESVFRKRQEGMPLRRAAIEGSCEVGPAVIASTLTTVAVFLPIVFVAGIAGQLFRDQALTVTISQLVSLAVALTLMPMLSSIGGSRSPPPAFAGDDPERLEMTLGRFSRVYDRLLRSAIRRRWATLGVAVAVFGLSVYSLRWLETELIPPLAEGEFFYEVHLPEGTSLAATDRTLSFMETAALESPAVERTYARIGSRLVSGGLSLNTKGENLGQLNVVLKDRGDRENETAVAAQLRDHYRDVPDLGVKLGRPSYFSLRTPIEVLLFGEELDLLRAYSFAVARVLEGVDGLVDVRSSLEAGNPELQVRFDRDRLAALGLDQARLSETLRDRVLGAVPTRFKERDRQIDIRVRNLEENRDSFDDVRNLVLPGPDGTPIRLLTVADVVEDRGPAEIHRLKQQRAAIVTANLRGRSLGSAIADIRARLVEAPPPRGITVELGGQQEEMEVSFASLRFALGLAIFLVYLVMAATFESFWHPFLILFTIPFALVGVVAALLATGTPVSVIVLIGGVLLVGIVVNNAIVLIDAVNRFRRRGLEAAEALRQAGHLRLRPILMTTITTLLGLVPMALSSGEGAELRAPLAITVFSGLLVGTVLTLIVIPAAYMAAPGAVRAEEAALSPEPPGGGAR